MPVLFTAVQRFDPSCGEEWERYVEWSKLTHLREVISLDNILCENIFLQLTTEDWNHNVQEDYKIHLFWDLDYVVERTAGNDRVNVLGAWQNPTMEDVKSFADPRFTFCGFDVVDVCCDVSALLNCGGFDLVFAPTELSECGLLTDHARALEVQQSLRREYPEEHHASCDVWAIWKLQR